MTKLLLLLLCYYASIVTMLLFFNETRLFKDPSCVVNCKADLYLYDNAPFAIVDSYKDPETVK